MNGPALPLRDCLILGSGRSGTSMVTGCLAGAGYFMGDELLGATPGNPLGYYEDRQVNQVNEALLASLVPPRPPVLGRLFLHRPRRNQRWLARVAPGTPIPSSPELEDRIRRLISRRPFCFKDPRLSYTLPAWRPFLPPSTLFICVFRHPARTAESMLREASREPYLRDLRLSFRRACEVWTLMYRHVLEIHAREGEWLFLHYDQVLKGEGLDRLAAATGAMLDRSFPRPSLRRSPRRRRAPRNAREVYRELCRRAGVEDPEVGDRAREGGL